MAEKDKQNNLFEKMKANIRLYTKYKMFAFDVLFYYAIVIPFFLQAKSMDMSEILFLGSIYSLSIAILQPFSNYFIEKVGLKNSTVIGNIFFAIQMVLLIFGNDFLIFTISQVLGALGMALKSTAESTILYESLVPLDKQYLFAKYEGLANSRYFYLDAVASIVAGLTFVINPYIPFTLTLIFILISLVLSCKFTETQNNIVKSISIKEYMHGLISIFKSNRSKALLVYALIITGTMTLSMSLYKAIILDFGISADVLAYIVCAYSIIMGIGTKLGDKIERKLRKKTLITFLTLFTTSFLVIGFIGLTEINSITIFIFAVCFIIMGIIHGAYRVAIKKYVINFTTTEVRTKITSLYYSAENLGGTILLFISGLLLAVFDVALTTIIIMVGILLLGMIIYYLTNKKIGLKPEDYNLKEINNIDVKTQHYIES